MDITINTPALLFPSIRLVMLAYKNRFMALSSVVRKLHDEYEGNHANKNLPQQIRNLQHRIKLVRRMQFFSVTSFLVALVSMYLIYSEYMQAAHIAFATAIILFAISLVLSLIEIMKSTNALELELSDIEEDDQQGGLVNYIKKHL